MKLKPKASFFERWVCGAKIHLVLQETPSPGLQQQRDSAEGGTDKLQVPVLSPEAADAAGLVWSCHESLMVSGCWWERLDVLALRG